MRLPVPAVLGILLVSLLGPAHAQAVSHGGGGDGATDDCERRDTEHEEEDAYGNGTVRKVRTSEHVVDCPADEDDRRTTGRQVTWEEDDGAASETTVRIVASDDDVHVDLVVDPEGDAPTVHLSMADNATVLVLEDALEVAFLEILEFDDRNGDGAFDLDDATLRAWRLADLPTEAERGDDTVTVTYLVPGGGTVAFVYHDAEDGRAKFDVVLRGLAFATPTSRLALRASFEAATAEYRRDGAHGALVTDADGVAASFDWLERAEADGTEAPVVATVYLGQGGAAGTAQLYLAYPRGAVVVHDPSVGYLAVQSVAVVKDVLFHPGAYAFSAAAAVAFLALGWVARRRK